MRLETLSLSLLSVFWPPTTLTGLLVWLITTILSFVHMIYRKKRKFGGNASIRIQWADFGLRTFAAGVSASVLIVQMSGLECLGPLIGLGAGGVYMAFGLIASLVLLVSNLRQKLDSFVIATGRDSPRN